MTVVFDTIILQEEINGQLFFCFFCLFVFATSHIYHEVLLCLVHQPVSLSGLQTRVSSLEEELSAKAAAMKSIQNELAQSRKELAAKELSVQRVRDELSRAQTRMALEGERVNILILTWHSFPLAVPVWCIPQAMVFLR